jgi:hypothetical protein
MSDLVNKRTIKLLAIIFLIFYLYKNNFVLVNSDFSYSYADKMEAVNYAKRYLNNQNYALESIGGCQRFGGYRYLFAKNIYKPVSSYIDPYFGWLYAYSDVTFKPEIVVLLSLIDKRFDYNLKNNLETDTQKFLGGYTLIDSKSIDNINIYILKPRL